MFYKELDVINRCLISIGTDKVSTLEDPDVDTDAAIAFLRQERANFLSEGHWFNTEHNFKLYLDNDNRIQVPEAIANVRPTSTNHKFTVRSGFLYDLTYHTFNMSKIARNGYIEAEVISILEFTDIPIVAQTIIGARTVIFFVTAYGSDTASVELEKRLLEQANSELLKFELQHQQYNQYNTPVASSFISGMIGEVFSDITGKRGE